MPPRRRIDQVPNWMVAVAWYGREGRAASAVGEQGFSTYQPMCRTRHVVRGRKLWVESHLFGRLFFVEMVPGDWLPQYVAVRHDPWVHHVLVANERPLVASEEEVERLRDQEEDGFVPTRIVNQFKQGQRVMVLRGPFKERVAAYDRYDEDDDEDRVTLGFLGKQHVIDLPRGSVASVN